MIAHPDLFFPMAFVGSALGGLGRHVVSGFVAHRIGERFPFGTLIVNVSGALLIGFVAGTPRLIADSATANFLAVGVLGGYTTVSSFSLNTLALAQNRQWRAAGANIAASWALCLGAAATGFAAASRLAAPL
jgi:fluoride exporter